MKKIFLVTGLCFIIFFCLIGFNFLPKIYPPNNLATHTENPLKKNRTTQKKSLCKEISKPVLATIPKNTIAFFKRDGSRQCDETPGTSPQKMQKTLTNLGIPVIQSAKAYFTMGRKPALCGEPTHNINIFYLPNTLKNEQINILLQKGFKSCTK